MTRVLRLLFAWGSPDSRSSGAFANAGVAQRVLFAAAVAIGPALLFWHLHELWNPSGAYAYGWIVPLLAAFLFKSRWEDRPAPSPSMGSAAFWAILFAFVTLPARWLQEAAPERSICAWTCALACIGIPLSLLALAGGTAWLRWFSFPLAFILTAVPWPHGLELLITNPLMHRTAGATVEILCLFGVPSIQAGNLVHIENGVIDIDEACSGIRSLQAMVMFTLFLGELFRLKLERRLFLIAFGLVITIAANIVRTVALSSIGFSQGMSAVDRWHDAAGLAVLVLSLTGAFVVAYKLRDTRAPQASAQPAAAPAPFATNVPAPGLISANPLPLRLCAGLLIWFAIAEIAVEAWYRLHEPKWQGWSWSVHWPQQAADFHFINIPQRSLRLLMCDESHAAAWKEPDGSDWSLYWIRWNPGNPAAETAKVHRPDVCLNAEGAVMENDLGTRLCTIGGMEVPFHSYTFRMGEKTLHVFFCLSEEIPGATTETTAAKDTAATSASPRFEGIDMFHRALQGRRHIGRQSLELAVSGYPSEASAQEAIKRHLVQLVQNNRGSQSPSKPPEP